MTILSSIMRRIPIIGETKPYSLDIRFGENALWLGEVCAELEKVLAQCISSGLYGIALIWNAHLAIGSGKGPSVDIQLKEFGPEFSEQVKAAQDAAKEIYRIGEEKWGGHPTCEYIACVGREPAIPPCIQRVGKTNRPISAAEGKPDHGAGNRPQMVQCNRTRIMAGAVSLSAEPDSNSGSVNLEVGTAQIVKPEEEEASAGEGVPLPTPSKSESKDPLGGRVQEQRKRGNWLHPMTDEPPIGWHGPLIGKMKDIAPCILLDLGYDKGDPRSLRSQVEVGVIWIKGARQSLRVYFKNQADFEKAKIRQKDAKENQKHQAKAITDIG